MAWVLVRYLIIFRLRHLIHSQVERLRDLHPVLGAFIIFAFRLLAGEPIRKSPAGINTSFMPIELVIVSASARHPQHPEHP